jgi:chromosome segregation ATPase
MTCLGQHIDDLDRMIDGNASKPDLRSQLAFIGREVAALEADYARLTQEHSNLKEAHVKLHESLAKLQDSPGAPSADTVICSTESITRKCLGQS